MSLWVKICGNTTLPDALLGAEAGADALGFVFAPSPRRVTAADVAAIVAHLPAAIEKIGVFVDAEWDEIYATVRACGLTGVQLHSASAGDLAARVHERLGGNLRVLRVVHFSPEAAEQAFALAQDPHVDAVLIDSRTATAVGGTGIAFDWVAARKTVFKDAKAWKCVAAGGLTAENVAEAIATLKPWGVDVASGVEATAGRKDAQKVRAFVQRARAAAGAVSA